jgi:CHAT domain-containing protein/tetratricopeptide (TPR) repeat protein
MVAIVDTRSKRTYHKSVFFSLLLCLAAFHSDAQELLDLVGWSAGQLVGEEGERLKLRIDSIDFQFAMSVNENAGFFDAQNKGEVTANVLADFKSGNMKSLEQRARDTLEFGLGQYGIRRYKMAERSFLNARNMMGGRTDHIIYLRVISSLGLAYLVQGRWYEAEKYIGESLRRSEDRLGKNSAGYIANLNNQAKLHQSLGELNLAEQEFTEARKLAESFFGPSMQRAIIINNQAMLAYSLGRMDQAVSLLNEAMTNASTARKKIIEGQSFDNRRFQLNLGTLLLSQGKFQEAEKILLDIKKAAESRGQTKNQEYGTLLNLIGVLYIQMGKNDKVEETLSKSAEVFRKRFNDVNYLSAKVLNDLGNFYRLTGKYGDAEKKLNDALSMRQTLFKPNHPDVVKTQEDLAILYWKTGKHEKAYAIYKDVMDKTVSFIFDYFPPMSETEKTKFWNLQQGRFQRFYNFCLEVKDKIPGCVNDLYEYHLITKGILLNATSKVRRSILTNSDVVLKNDYLQWIDLREQLAEAYGYSKNKLKAQNINLEQLEAEANTLEKSLSTRSASFSKEYAPRRVRVQELSQVLQDQECVVDILRVRNFNQDFVEGSRYIIFLLRNGKTAPEVIVLDNGSEMEGRNFKLYRNTIRAKVAQSDSYKMYWSPIDSQLSNIKVLHLSMDGVYNQININTLRNESGQFMIEKYDIKLLGNARDLVQNSSTSGGAAQTNATLIGFPSYGSKFSPLLGTKIELENISQILKTRGYKISTFIQQDASEKKIKSIKSPMVLHVASHGYFEPNNDDSKSSFALASDKVTDNPLLRSGLILAEASSDSEVIMDMSNNDDGFLTAYEVINLSLDETGLVILSACETALGDVVSGEGVYGLQRAFLMAGSRFIVMSLWKVDDAATQELMVNFYKNWNTVKDFHSAFKNAQLQLKQKYPDPYYWGAFIMIGNSY